MPAASMSAASTYSTVHATATGLHLARRCARAPQALTCLESLRPSTERARRAAPPRPPPAGPASGPRPTSSSPTTTPAPRPCGERPLERVQRGQPLAAPPASAARSGARATLHGVAHALARVGHERALEHGELPRARLLQPLPYLGDRRPHAPARPFSSARPPPRPRPFPSLSHDSKSRPTGRQKKHGKRSHRLPIRAQREY